MDLEEKFLVLSRSGNIYIFILYVKDSNTILETPIKQCSCVVMIVSYEKILKTITRGRFEPDFQVIENGISTATKEILKLGNKISCHTTRKTLI